MPAVRQSSGGLTGNQVYFANEVGEVLGSALFQRIAEFREYLTSTGQMALWSNLYEAYYKEYYTAGVNTKSGSRGQYTNTNINQFKSILDRLQSVISQQRIKWSARATNSDSASLKQTILANDLLDYYLKTQNLTELVQSALSWGFLTGEGFIACTWDSQSGKVVGQFDANANVDGSHPEYPPDADGTVPEHEPDMIDIHQGDIRSSVFDPTCVVRDPNAYSWEACAWVLTIELRNKFDEAAKYPDLADRLTALSVNSTDEKQWHFTANWWGEQSNDLIPVYHFYHKKTPACPAGRYVKLYADDLVVIETGLPYESIPVYRFAPQEHAGTPFGYSVATNLLPIQQSYDILNDTIITNHEVFGVQSVAFYKESGNEWQQLANGMTAIELNHIENVDSMPKGLNLLSVAKDSYEYQSKLESEMNLISGINAVARGEPPPGVTAGIALALIQSMAIQTNMPAQLRYVTFLERLGSGIITTLKAYAQVPRIAEIVGKANRSFVKEFSSKDLDKVQRVLVEMGNPLTDTGPGRVALAEQLLQAKMISTPQEFLTVIDTGTLDPLTQGDQAELLLIRKENEMLSDMEGVIALQFDAHQLHIKEHKAVLADPEMRQNAQFVQNVVDHITTHQNFIAAAAPPPVLGVPPGPGAPSVHPATPGAPQPGVPHASVPGAPSQGTGPAARSGALTTPATAGAASAAMAASVKPAQPPHLPTPGVK